MSSWWSHCSTKRLRSVTMMVLASRIGELMGNDETRPGLAQSGLSASRKCAFARTVFREELREGTHAT